MFKDLPEGQTHSYTASEVLSKYQRQIDEDGTEIGVSRQALDEVLSELSSQAEQIRKLRADSTRGINLMLEVGRLANGEETLELFNDVEKIKEHIRKLEEELLKAQDEHKLACKKQCCEELEQQLHYANQAAAAEADEVNRLSATISAALEARIEEADKQEPAAYLITWDDVIRGSGKMLSFKRSEITEKDYPRMFNTETALFTRPPITPQRELELLEVIERLKNALLATGIKWPVVLDALAITPSLSTLKEHDARVLEEAAHILEHEREFDAITKMPIPSWQTLRRMAGKL